MTNKTSKALSESLGIEHEIVEYEEVNSIEEIREETETDVDQDYKLSRKTFHDLIDKGNFAIEGMSDLAKESESPRAYEVLATLIKTVSDTTKDLYDLQKKTKDLKSDNAPSDSSVTNIDKAVFVGSTSELLKQIKNNKDD